MRKGQQVDAPDPAIAPWFAGGHQWRGARLVGGGVHVAGYWIVDSGPMNPKAPNRRASERRLSTLFPGPSSWPAVAPLIVGHSRRRRGLTYH